MKKIFFTIFTLITLGASAQSHSDTIRLRQVVVTATQHATSRGEAPQAVGVVDKSQMEAISAVSLGESLRIGTGLRVENTCQNCGSNELRINGLGQAYSQILIDSRPVNSSLVGVYLLDQLPTALIDRVEILRGGGSALYGSNAIAGVVNVITREPLANEASIANTTRLVGGSAIDLSNQFNASVLSRDRRAGLAIFGHNRHRDAYDRNGDGFSEVGLLKAHMLGLKGFIRTSDVTKLGLEYHNIHDFRRGGDRLDLPSPLAHISEGGEHDIHCAYLFLMLLCMINGYPSVNEFRGMPVETAAAMKVGPWALIVTYFFLTVAELFISPLGLSFVSKIAPKHIQGICQGLWLSATAIGNLLILLGPVLYNGMSNLWMCWLVFLLVCAIAMFVMFGMLKWLEKITSEKQ